MYILDAMVKSPCRTLFAPEVANLGLQAGWLVIQCRIISSVVLRSPAMTVGLPVSSLASICLLIEFFNLTLPLARWTSQRSTPPSPSVMVARTALRYASLTKSFTTRTSAKLMFESILLSSMYGWPTAST